MESVAAGQSGPSLDYVNFAHLSILPEPGQQPGSILLLTTIGGTMSW
jgi:hypothetical protein